MSTNLFPDFGLNSLHDSQWYNSFRAAAIEVKDADAGRWPMDFHHRFFGRNIYIADEAPTDRKFGRIVKVRLHEHFNASLADTMMTNWQTDARPSTTARKAGVGTKESPHVFLKPDKQPAVERHRRGCPISIPLIKTGLELILYEFDEACA